MILKLECERFILREFEHPRLLYNAQGHLEGKGCEEGVDGCGTHQGIPQDANACLNGKRMAAAKIGKLGAQARTIWQLPTNRRPTITMDPLYCIGMRLGWGATTYGIHRVGHTKACARKISERMDPLNSVEAGRRTMGLGLICVCAQAIGWLVSIELRKAPSEPVACEGWCRRGL